MSQKVPVDDFKWVEETSGFNKDFIERYISESDKRYFLEVDDEYPEKIHNLHNHLPFLPEAIKIEKIEKLEANVHDKKEYFMQRRNLKQSNKSWISIKNSV